MKQWIITLAFLLTSVIPATGSAGIQDFMLENQTGFEIYAVYFAHSGMNNWSDDFLGQQTLPYQTWMTMPFAPSENACFYDMRVADISGGTLDFQKINLCSISKVTLYYAAGVAWATVE